MATLVILATTGDVCGFITRIDDYNLNPWDPTSDWEQVGGQIRNAVAAAAQIEETEKASARQELVDELERVRKERAQEISGVRDPE